MGVLTLGNWFRDWEMYEQVVARMPEETFHLVNRQLPLEVAERLMQFPNVHYHRNLSDAELNSLMTRCSLAFLPLLKLAGSNALLECLSAGLPVVVSAVNAVEDVSLPKRCVARFQATIPDDAVRHLRAFKTSVSVADRLGCVEIAKTFSWLSVAERTYELYQNSL
jgi:glycosyltransferase involved in cell wall biosynthesis